MPLLLEVVAENLSRQKEMMYPRYEDDPRFNSDWWREGSARSPVSYCRFIEDGQEVGRAKVLPGAGVYAGYTTWACPRGGVTEIDLIEIRIDLQRSGDRYGQRAVQAIGQAYGEPMVAMSLNEQSDLFWHALGWGAHRHPDSDRGSTLFSSD